jgi:hypothetical protein
MGPRPTHAWRVLTHQAPFLGLGCESSSPTWAEITARSVMTVHLDLTVVRGIRANKICLEPFSRTLAPFVPSPPHLLRHTERD